MISPPDSWKSTDWEWWLQTTPRRLQVPSAVSTIYGARVGSIRSTVLETSKPSRGAILESAWRRCFYTPWPVRDAVACLLGITPASRHEDRDVLPWSLARRG